MEIAWTSSDPLGEALHSLRMTGIFYSRCDFSAPWGLRLPPMADFLMFHFVTAGRCWLSVAGEEDLLIQPGDLVLLPHGEGHDLLSDTGARTFDLFDLPRAYESERYELLRMGGGGAQTSLVCGAVRFEHPAAQQLVRVLPAVLRVEATASPEHDWMQGTLRYMAAEAKAMRPGGETVITRLADVLIVQAIRAWIETAPAAQSGWLGALHDRQIGQAIALIQRAPERDWTVASLAHEVAMSRSAFAARFTELVGQSPMQYVAWWRTHVAQALIRDENASISELAPRLGYQSEAAFRRAFKRMTGKSPGMVRRTAATSVTSA